MWELIKLYLPKFVRNADKIIASIIFFCTISGAWFLYSYASGNGVIFLELIQPNLLVSYGAFSFFLIFFIIGIFLAAFLFSPVIARSLYFHILIKERFGRRKEIIKSYFVFFLFCSCVAAISYHKLEILPPALAGVVLLQHLAVFEKKLPWENIKRSIQLFICALLLLIITYGITGFLALTLNFKIENNLSFNGILQSIFVFATVFALSAIGLADVHQRKEDSKNRFIGYALFSLLGIFYISTAFSNGVSEGITRQIGLGYTYRCYYTSDISKYAIPEVLIFKQKRPEKIKLFIISDTNGKKYLSRGENYPASFSFTARELSEIACDR